MLDIRSRSLGTKPVTPVILTRIHSADPIFSRHRDHRIAGRAALDTVYQLARAR